MRGNDTKFFTVDHSTANPTPYGYDVARGEHKASLIAVAIPYGSGERLPNPLDIEGHEKYDINKSQVMEPRGQNGVKPSFYQDAIWVSEWFQLHEFARDRTDAHTEPFIEHEKMQNTVCFRGHQFSYDPTTEKHDHVQINTGHCQSDFCRALFRMKHISQPRTLILAECSALLRQGARIFIRGAARCGRAKSSTSNTSTGTRRHRTRTAETGAYICGR